VRENSACLEITLLLPAFESENPVMSGGLGFAGSVPSVYTYAITAIIASLACSDAVTVNKTGCLQLEWYQSERD